MARVLWEHSNNIDKWIARSTYIPQKRSSLFQEYLITDNGHLFQIYIYRYKANHTTHINCTDP
jgi:hypothetical protein